MSWNRTTISILVGVLLIVGLVWGFWPESVAVETAVAEHGRLEVTIEEEARTQVTDRYVIATPVTGYVQRIGLDEGARVSPGDELFVMEPHRSEMLDPRRRAEARASVDAAQASLARAEEVARATQADAEYAESEFRRIDRLWQEEAATDQERERAASQARHLEAQWASAVRAVEVAEHQKQVAEAAFRVTSETASGGADDNLHVRAPHEATVLRVHRESEGVVRAGEPLVEIGETTSLEVVADVLTSEAVRLRPGMPVQFERWGGASSVSGEVLRVEPQGFTKISALGVEEQRVRVISVATASDDEWERVGDGYRVIARFIVSSDDDVLSIPSNALFKMDGKWAVFTVESGRSRVRFVSPGRDAGLRVEINGGLEQGEEVIVHPDHTLEDGMRVSVRDENVIW
ncbi:efflux transporter periplasmic adaptor subunit [Longibacter salinarum]|uniref:Efflux transporter periplasmic adaptor subunit n=1 Tax=Longibacter salinarum TaxID=1850348 RepID=A0A2A8CWD9_9BACT|nr:HlyD family efflux transporter periplasmic adaptor subunit [Longibacter salinarum]PEN12921.1 efflux transporter periplasmic adaptor subunit [Longibacter salinarum]